MKIRGHRVQIVEGLLFIDGKDRTQDFLASEFRDQIEFAKHVLSQAPRIVTVPKHLRCNLEDM
jgi:hypothetical protein